MGLVVLGELIAIVGVLLEAEHAQPSCQLGLVWVIVLFMMVKVFVGQLSALAEGVGTEGRAGAGLFADGLGGAGGRDDGLAVAAGIGEGVVGGGGGGRSGDRDRLGLHVSGSDGGSGCGCGLGGAVTVGCRGNVDAEGWVDLVGGSGICHGWG